MLVLLAPSQKVWETCLLSVTILPGSPKVRKYMTPAQKRRPLANGSGCPPARNMRRLPINAIPASTISHEEIAIRAGVNSICPPSSSLARLLFRKEMTITTAATKIRSLAQSSSLHCIQPFYCGSAKFWSCRRALGTWQNIAQSRIGSLRAKTSSHIRGTHRPDHFSEVLDEALKPHRSASRKRDES